MVRLRMTQFCRFTRPTGYTDTYLRTLYKLLLWNETQEVMKQIDLFTSQILRRVRREQNHKGVMIWLYTALLLEWRGRNATSNNTMVAFLVELWRKMRGMRRTSGLVIPGRIMEKTSRKSCRLTDIRNSRIFRGLILNGDWTPVTLGTK